MKKKTTKKLNMDKVLKEQYDFQLRVEMTTHILNLFFSLGEKGFKEIFSKEVREYFKLDDETFTDPEYVWEYCDYITSSVNRSKLTNGKYLTFNKEWFPYNEDHPSIFVMSKKMFYFEETLEDCVAYVFRNE